MAKLVKSSLAELFNLRLLNQKALLVPDGMVALIHYLSGEHFVIAITRGAGKVADEK